MHRDHRRLSPSFIAHLDALHLFPGRHELRDWCAANGRRGFANKFHGPMHDGTSVPRFIIDLLVTFCIRRRSIDGTAPHADALLEYCRRHRFEGIDPRYHAQIVDIVSASTAARPMKPLDNAAAFTTTLAKNADVAHRAFREAADSELVRAIEWCAVEYGRQLAERPLAYTEALRSGFDRRGTTLDCYLGRVRTWRRVTPLVIGIASDANGAVGATIALPLRAHAYRGIRAGQMNTRDLRSNDLSPTSRFLFLEAIVMEPHRTKARQKEPSDILVASFFAQLALLSRVTDIAKDPPIHLLSATFSDFARRRLEGLGCSIVGARHAGTEHELMERVVDIRRPNTEDAALWGNWRALQHQLSIARGEGLTRGKASRRRVAARRPRLSPAG